MPTNPRVNLLSPPLQASSVPSVVCRSSLPLRGTGTSKERSTRSALRARVAPLLALPLTGAKPGSPNFARSENFHVTSAPRKAPLMSLPTLYCSSISGKATHTTHINPSLFLHPARAPRTTRTKLVRCQLPVILLLQTRKAVCPSSHQKPNTQLCQGPERRTNNQKYSNIKILPLLLRSVLWGCVI